MNPRVTLRLEALPGNSPPLNRLRAALKCLLRRYGFRALAVPTFSPEEFDQVEPLRTSAKVNKFRQAFAAGETIVAEGHEPLRVIEVLAADRLVAIDEQGRRITIEPPWDYRRLEPPAAAA